MTGRTAASAAQERRAADDSRAAPDTRAAYPRHVGLGTRWGDNDVYGHVNKVGLFG
ncbi:hypothetical protein [Methylobacterium nigriterrae]|uniref:hypothetical protein n=1 Tax=Methylobacterium nigriterrae TaxID=3127512 RepID=UPI003013CBF3